MDPNTHRLIKTDNNAADETRQAGGFLFGGAVLVLIGVALLMQAHATVADWAGGMLALIGGALIAAAFWLYSQRG